MVGYGHWLREFVPTLMLGVLVGSCDLKVESVDYLTIPGQFADEGVTEPLIALEAFFDETQFYIRYRGAEGVVHSGGEWANRISLEDVEAGKAYPGPYLLPLEYRQQESWETRPAETITGSILSPKDWRDFREQLFSSSLSTAEKSGLALHFYVDDYFLYYDDAAVFQSTLLVDKPANYSIKESISFTEYLQRGLPLLEVFLKEKNIAERRILFNTGDTGAYSLPFLYVNLDLPLVVFARYEPAASPKVPAGPVDPYIQTAGHVAHSHLGGLVTRPISSLYRLFFVATDTVRETATPHWLINLEAIEIPPIYEGPGMDLDAWEEELDRTTGRASSKGTIDYLVDGEEFFTRFIDAMTSSVESIHLRTYIFDNDDFAEKIAELLKRRSNENIDVKMLFDGIGTIFSTIEKQQSLPEDWEGVVSVRGFLEADSEVEVRQAPNPWFTGDHVKTIIVDHRVAFTGGMNIAREYRYDWHDLMMEVHGPVVDILREEFHKAWAHAGFFGDYGYFLQRMMPTPSDAEDIGYPVRVLFTRIDDPEIFLAQRRAIRNSKRYIYVENAYFTDDVMLHELVRARRRGVDVRVIMPLVTDRGHITRNNALAANVMLEHGIRVFIYPGMSHVKAAVFDGWACLGSANWDNWSLSINKELNLATSHPEAVDGLLERVFQPDFARSVELTEPFPERWSDALLELVGDYIF
jgi:cardiolipin synthase